MDTLTAIFDLMNAYGKIVADQKAHSAPCRLSKRTPAYEKILRATQRLLRTCLDVFEQMAFSIYFQLCVGFYKKIFGSQELIELFGTDTWTLHVELLANRVNQIYNENKIEEIRAMFSHSGSPQLLVILRYS